MVVGRLERISMLSQQVGELKVQLDSIYAKRENLANHVREGFDVNGRIGADRMSGNYAARRE